MEGLEAIRSAIIEFDYFNEKICKYNLSDLYVSDPGLLRKRIMFCLRKSCKAPLQLQFGRVI